MKINAIEIENKIKDYLIRNIKVDEVEDTRILYLKEDDYLSLWNYYNSLLEKAENEDEKKLIKEIFKSEIKFINPIVNGKPIGIKVMSYSMKPSFAYVVDKKKILEKYIDNIFYKWKNKFLKETKKKAKNINNEIEKKKFLDKAGSILKNAEEILNNIKANPNKYEILYTAYVTTTKKYTPIIIFNYFKDPSDWDSKVSTYKNLRKTAINVVFETNKVPIRKMKEWKVEKLIREMNELCPKIYYKKLDK